MEQTNSSKKRQSILSLYKKNSLILFCLNIFCLIPILLIEGLLILIFGAELVKTNIYLTMLCLPLSYPLFIGANHICYKIIADKEFSLIKDFFKGVKENIIKSIISGFMFYFIFSTIIVSINFYYQCAAENPMFWVFFVCTIIIAAISAFFFFSVNTMIVIFELDLKSILKNSLLACFGEMKDNFIALFKISIVLGIFFVLSYANFFIFLAYAILLSLIIFSLMPLIYINQLYKNFIRIIGGQSDNTNKKNQNEEIIVSKSEVSKEKLSEIIDTAKDDEYIYYNGKMILKSEFIQIQKENEN